MRFFFFGPPERRLFGAFHPAESSRQAAPGVLLCHPIGGEYAQTYRALRQLGLRLARRGLPTLRFDYFGFGDSAGDDDAATFQGWTADVGTAAAELRRQAGVDKLCLVGVRAGAALAYVAATGRADLDGIVLWGPVISGADYMNELAARRSGQPETEVPLLPGRLSDEFAGMELDAYPVPLAGRVLVVESAASVRSREFSTRLAGAGTLIAHREVADAALWAGDSAMDLAQVPRATLDAIVGWLAG